MSEVISEYEAGPIKQYLNDIIRIMDNIPNDRYITKEEINNLNTNDLSLTFFYNFPRKIKRNLHIFPQIIYYIMKWIPDDSLVFMPGLGPVIIKFLIDLSFKIDEDTYRFPETYKDFTSNYVKEHGTFFPENEPVPYGSIIKRIKFIAEPIPSVDNFSSEIESYIRNMFKDINIQHFNNIYFIKDGIEDSNQTYNVVNSLLPKINPNVKFNNTGLHRIFIDGYGKYNEGLNEVLNFIKDTKDYNLSYFPYHQDFVEYYDPNLRVVNFTIAFVYQLVIGRIRPISFKMRNVNHIHFEYFDPLTLSEKPINDKIHKGSFYMIRYYDMVCNCIKEIFCYVNKVKILPFTESFIKVNLIEKNSAFFPLMDILLETIVQFAHIPTEYVHRNKIKYQHDYKFPVAGDATLINDVKVKVISNKLYFTLLDKKPKQYEKNEQNLHIKKDFILNFNPTHKYNINEKVSSKLEPL